MKIETFDYSVDLKQVELWQYDKATRLISLINQKQVWYDANQTQFWTDWYSNVFNLVTANDFGLCVWSIILNIPYLIQSENLVKPVWGFNISPSENHNKNFTRGSFAEFSSARVTLSIEEQRIFLRLRAFQLMTRGAIPDVNVFLDMIFNDPNGLYVGGAWAIDNLDMTMTYAFNCPISSPLLEAIEIYDVLPHPNGVFLNLVIL